MRDEDAHDLVAALALDALHPIERRRFEAHLVRCEPCRCTLPGLRGAAAALALDVAQIAPPPGLREKVVRAGRAQRDVSRRVFVHLRQPRAAAALAGIAAIAACAAVGLGLWGMSVSGDLDRERRVAAIVGDPAALRYPLVGARGYLAVTGTRSAALVVSGLGPAPSEKTYELWVVVNSRPRPAGLFRGDRATSLVRLTQTVPRGAHVAVSVEPEGGSRRLTGTPLFTAYPT